MKADEPTSEEAARRWISGQVESTDPFRELALATERHRVEHGCDTYASSDGPLLGVVARAARARRILEVGTGLGYSTAWLAHGAPDGHIDTIEADSSHTEATQAHLQRLGLANRVQIHLGRSPEALELLEPPYDLVFYDAHVPTPVELAGFRRLLRPGGLLVTSNLFLGQYDASLPGLEQGAVYRLELFEPGQWLTTFSDLKALSVRL